MWTSRSKWDWLQVMCSEVGLPKSWQRKTPTFHNFFIAAQKLKANIINLRKTDAGGTLYGNILYYYGQCTHPSLHPLSLDSIEDCLSASSSSTLLVSLLSSLILWFTSLWPIETHIPIAWSMIASALHFGWFSNFSLFVGTQCYKIVAHIFFFVD